MRCFLAGDNGGRLAVVENLILSSHVTGHLILRLSKSTSKLSAMNQGSIPQVIYCLLPRFSECRIQPSIRRLCWS